MEAVGDDIADGLGAVAGPTAGLFNHKAERGGLVHEPQLAPGVLGVGRVEEDAALEQGAVKVGHQGADIATRVGPLGLAVGLLQMVDIGAGRGEPGVATALVDAVGRTALRNTDMFVGQQKVANAAVQGEAVHALAGGVDQRRAGAVQGVAGRHLTPTAQMQGVHQRGAFFPLRATVDRKDGADRHIDIQV